MGESDGPWNKRQSSLEQSPVLRNETFPTGYDSGNFSMCKRGIQFAWTNKAKQSNRTGLGVL